ncbi:glutamate-5-semialdehyde dehydrogenase [Trueperella sp. LYQ143]|uniref:glutamate-5-semialdehyde dehydrogenase n=1 Tax=unclassified Trueperella TaxID=2630174 RepID=UPI003982DD70
MDTARHAIEQYARHARIAAQELRLLTSQQKNSALFAIADALEADSAQIVQANSVDMERERAGGMRESLLDRLLLTSERIAGIAQAVREVAALPDPVGEVINGRTLPNGLRLICKRVPLGVLGMIYEARPNVTVDAAALAIKSGNAVLLRGGSAARESNQALVAVIRRALTGEGLCADAVITIDEYGRAGAQALLQARGFVDVVIPRGGAGLIQMVVREATVPTIETGVGNCHIYVDRSADLDKAEAIILNAKVQRPGVCNAVETVLVHQDIAADFLPRIGRRLQEAGVRLHADSQAGAYLENYDLATEEDWETEYNSLDLALGVVADLSAAIGHIRRYSSGHTEAIVAQDWAAINRFTDSMDSAAVMINASTRFTDGGQLGLGAEIGISTQKLHARGPMGLTELTTTTWIVQGDGHVRA